MIELNASNISIYKNDFEKFLGKDFILQADKFLSTNEDSSLGNIHPFYELWKSYNLDISQTANKKKLHCSFHTAYLLNLLSNLKDIENLPNFHRLINSLLQASSFYSAVFEIQIAALYSFLYKVQINEECPNEKKTPDFSIWYKENKINIECKSLQDFEISNNKASNNLIKLLQKYCNDKQKSYKVIIKTGNDLHKQFINCIQKDIIKLIKNDVFGKSYLEKYKIEVEIVKLEEWNEPHYGNLQIFHPSRNCRFEITHQLQILFNGVSEYKNIIFIGIESKPILNFDKRIKDEINKARKQFPKDEFNILHIQLPFSDNLNFESYINNNYEIIKNILEKSTTRINSIFITNPTYNTPNIQTFIIPNCKVCNEINFDFRYPYSNIEIPTIPDIHLEKPNSKIELKNMFYTPNIDWKNIPTGTIMVNLVSSTGKTQFRIWKSYDLTLTFDYIIDGNRKYFKTKNHSFLINRKNKIDITIENKQVIFYINDKEISNT